MPTFILFDVSTFIHGYDFTSTSNKVTLTPSADPQDSTTFGSGGYRSRKGGLRTVDFELAGFWDSDPDDQTFSGLGVTNHAVTVSPTAAESSIAYMFQAGRFEYELLGSVGEMTPISVQMQGSSAVGLVRGQVAKARGNVSATGALGSAVNLGAGAAGKFIYATVHVFTPGTTATLIIQSDNTSGFLSPTTVATIGPLTTAGGTFMTRVDAATITDNWFRFNVSAITGTFNLAGAIGVQ